MKKKEDLEQVELFFQLTSLGRKKKLFNSPVTKKTESNLPKHLEEVMQDSNKFQTILSGITDPKERQQKLVTFFRQEQSKSDDLINEEQEDFWTFIKSTRVERDEKVDFRTILRNSRIDRKGPVQIIETDEYKHEMQKKSLSFRDIPHTVVEEEIVDETIKVDFAYVLSHKELSKAYEHFLQTEHNQNQFTFLRKLDELTAVDSSSTAKKMALLVNELYNTYIKEGSKQELNIGSESRKEVEEKLKDQLGVVDYWKLSEPPNVVFNPVKGILLLEMKYDTFMRFQKTEKFLEILKNIQKKKKRGSTTSKSTGRLTLH